MYNDDVSHEVISHFTSGTWIREHFADLNSYLDRINVSNARLAGLQEDLHMSDTVWNTGISTFYIGYLIGQLPGNMLLAKANPRWFLPSMMLAWSIGTIC